MIIRIDSSIPSRLAFDMVQQVVEMARSVGGRVEYLGDEITITRRPLTTPVRKQAG